VTPTLDRPAPSPADPCECGHDRWSHPPNAGVNLPAMCREPGCGCRGWKAAPAAPAAHPGPPRDLDAIRAAARALIEARERATLGWWLYRPDEFDDWGFIRADVRGPLVACARAGRGSAIEDDEHRRAGTDPYEPNGRFIAAAANGIAPLAADALALCGEVERQDRSLERIATEAAGLAAEIEAKGLRNGGWLDDLDTRLVGFLWGLGRFLSRPDRLPATPAGDRAGADGGGAG
jgi:hypothetical protein